MRLSVLITLALCSLGSARLEQPTSFTRRPSPTTTLDDPSPIPHDHPVDSDSFYHGRWFQKRAETDDAAAAAAATDDAAAADTAAADAATTAEDAATTAEPATTDAAETTADEPTTAEATTTEEPTTTEQPTTTAEPTTTSAESTTSTTSSSTSSTSSESTTTTSSASTTSSTTSSTSSSTSSTSSASSTSSDFDLEEWNHNGMVAAIAVASIVGAVFIGTIGWYCLASRITKLFEKPPPAPEAAAAAAAGGAAGASAYSMVPLVDGNNRPTSEVKFDRDSMMFASSSRTDLESVVNNNQRRQTLLSADGSGGHRGSMASQPRMI